MSDVLVQNVGAGKKNSQREEKAGGNKIPRTNKVCLTLLPGPAMLTEYIYQIISK